MWPLVMDFLLFLLLVFLVFAVMWNSLTPPSHGYPASRAITTGGRCTCQAPASCTIGHRLCDDVHARCQENPKTFSCFAGSLGPKVAEICICYSHYIPLHYQNHLLLLWFLACLFPAMCFHSIAHKMLLSAVSEYAVWTSLTHQGATLITSVKAEPPPRVWVQSHVEFMKCVKSVKCCFLSNVRVVILDHLHRNTIHHIWIIFIFILCEFTPGAASASATPVASAVTAAATSTLEDTQ